MSVVTDFHSHVLPGIEDESRSLAVICADAAEREDPAAGFGLLQLEQPETEAGKGTGKNRCKLGEAAVEEIRVCSENILSDIWF